MTTTTTTTSSTTTTTFYVPDAYVGFDYPSATERAKKITLNTIYKQSRESFAIYADFVDTLPSSETILPSQSSVRIVDSSGNDVTATMCRGLEVTDTKLRTKLKAAGLESASPYKVTFTAVTSLGNTYELDGKIRVVDL